MESERFTSSFLDMNVGRNNVRPIIESVLEQFTNIRLAGPLPSPATTGNLFAEAQILAKIQAAAAIVENENSTLHYDETSKYGEKQDQFKSELVGDLMLWDFLTKIFVQLKDYLIQ